ncbi:hypothetical protein B0T26DRAFT_809063 [Lasiosphaeria miniovina]|uniref:NADPH-dependent 1-acyldihydroxyacetone phosphate reductase n=1 Tax=Lasiosphaeria miniovina TaxID=1954250 RepID=A0AA40BID4_9PEZI|nr:uncharacterized protein B0T26DRAFT_809063 [Lasiosphaeria miniovina]KAK0734759.1 hypothetical protein B0T26DRAFT_809063 [Lasiosphaeria miniovina]
MAGTSSTAPKKTVLITGCSAGGIGWAPAKAFRAQGFHVFATLRNAAQAGRLSDNSNNDMDVLALDVLVNNAGAEFVFWGPLAIVQAFAPLLIKARGTVANNSSIAQGLPMAWTGDAELAPLGVRVVTVMVGSVATPMFTRPGGRMQLPEASHYRGFEEYAHRMRLLHLDASMPVAPGTIRGPIWLGTYALLVRFATWAMPQWWVDQTANNDRAWTW